MSSSRRALMLVRTLLALSFLAGGSAFAAQRHPAFGLVLKIESPRSIVVSCAEIPSLMKPMEMSLVVADPSDLAALQKGMMIDFMLVADGGMPIAEHIRIHHYAGSETEPLAVKRMEMLGNVLSPGITKELLAAGQAVPDFELIDQTREAGQILGFFRQDSCHCLPLHKLSIC